jgi:hypothetical protein
MSGWEVLDLDGDPTPGDPDGIALLAAGLLNEAQLADQRASQLQAVADNSGDLQMQGDYAPRFLEILSQLPASHAALSTSYQTCAESLTAYADSLSEAKAQSAAALDQGTEADSRYQDLLEQFCGLAPIELTGPGVWRGLNGFSAAELSENCDADTQAEAISIGNEAGAAEDDRQAAVSMALDAADYLSEAQSLCSQQIGDAAELAASAGSDSSAGAGASTNAAGGSSDTDGTVGGSPAGDDSPGGVPDDTSGEAPADVVGTPDDAAPAAEIPPAASPSGSSEPSPGDGEPEDDGEPDGGEYDEELRSKLLDMQSDMAEKAYEKALDQASSQNSGHPSAQPPPGASPIGVNPPAGVNPPPRGNPPPTTTPGNPWQPGQIGSLSPHQHPRHQPDKVERKLEPISHGDQPAAQHQTASAEGSGTEPAGGVSDGDENALRESR